jgi:hypothetical protein
VLEKHPEKKKKKRFKPRPAYKSTSVLRTAAATLRLIYSAGKVLNRGHISTVALPEVAPAPIFTPREISLRLKKIDRLIKLFVIRKQRLCYYRAYVLGTFLRQWSIPVTFNVGLRNLRGRDSAGERGHCWLTLAGRPILEMDDPENLYPHVINETPGGIRYCVGLKEPSILRHKATRPPDSIYDLPPIAVEIDKGTTAYGFSSANDI